MVWPLQLAPADPGGEEIAENNKGVDVGRQRVNEVDECRHLGVATEEMGVSEQRYGPFAVVQRRINSARLSLSRNAWISRVRVSRSRTSEMNRFCLSSSSGTRGSPVL